MTASVLVELDRWEEWRNLRTAYLKDDSHISVNLNYNRNNKRVLDRTAQLGDYAFRVFIEEFRGETTFLLRASMAIRDSRRKRRVSREIGLRERPLKPVYGTEGGVYWPLDRTGVYADYPALWDDIWAGYFIEETLDYLRSPEVPTHEEVHTDNSSNEDYED